MNEEVLKVLEMVRDGKLSPKQGEALLCAMKPAQEPQDAHKKSMLRIRVDVNDPDKAEQAKVNVNVPLSLAKKAAGLVALVPKDAKAELAENGIDLDAINLPELIALFEDGELTEELVNVKTGTEQKGATVKIYVD